MTQFDLHIDAVDRQAHRSAGTWAGAGLGLMLLFISRISRFCVFTMQKMIAAALCALMQRPFATILYALCLWGGANVLANLHHQNGPHPSPLFAKKDLTVKALPSLPPELFQASYEVQPAAETGVDMREVQKLLAQKGIYKGAIDGRMGPMTSQAVRDYQALRGFKVTGVADQDLLDDLQTEKTANRYETDDILIFTVQNRLNQLGFQAGAANGKFNAKTRAAIEKFETAQGLAPTGSISSELLKALTKATLTPQS